MKMQSVKRGGKLALALGGVFCGMSTSAKAALLLYDGFDYTVGSALGGSGTTPTGQTNVAYSATWYGRQTGSTYNETNDSTIAAGNLSYGSLATSTGNSLSLGRSAASTALVSDSIALPGGAITTGTVYYSLLFQVNNATGLGTSPSRFPFASLSIDPAGDSRCRHVTVLLQQHLE